MSKTEKDILKAFTSLRDDILNGSKSKPAKPFDPSTVAAILVLASEFYGIRRELKRIRKVLLTGYATSKIGKSDVPDNMLALLSALKAVN